ncbi:hypothetical protein DL98DRAFT_450927 [Cadophora sp. DSE1049]|nr:hypothetical protein DL98DRAFT_450927 [Cadophora sp. DSE1049]
MKTVPSLVASSTVGIAVAGLALGKPERSSPPRPSSKKRKAGDIAGVVIHNSPNVSSPISRPGTSSTVITPESKPAYSPAESTPAKPPTLRQRPSNTRSELQNNNSGRKLSVFRHEEVPGNSEEETRRESVSSRGSWMRRLSTIPNSHNNSPRSSIGPDSPSLTVSHGSVVPILSNPGSRPAQLPPNKLVKRTTSTSGRAASGSVSRSGSRSQVPTLRRPATSHQRVTLQQQFRDDSIKMKEPIQPDPTTRVHVTPIKNGSPASRHAWRLYFESRPTKLSKERASGRLSDGGTPNFPSTSRRIILDDSARPTLVKPGIIMVSKNSTAVYYDESFELDDDEVEAAGDTPLSSSEVVEEPQKRARRSLSMHFSSPSSWIPRSGSLRGNKRNADGRSGGKRYSSAPVVSTMPGRSISTAHGSTTSRHRPIMDPSVFQRSPVSPTEEASPSDPFATSFARRSRNSSSPLPPLTRLSSFNVDLARLGLSSSSSSAPRRSPNSPVVHTSTTSPSVSSTGHASPASISFVGSAMSKPPRTSELTDRASTLIGSDNDMRGFTSGDEDDIDFQSETVFDSLRSGATGSLRSHNAPLDSMFDESPPSINGHSKGKRLSIHEMLANGGFQEGHNRIVEEDEGMSTPVKGGRSSQEDSFQTPVRISTVDSDRVFPSSPPSFCLATKDFNRLSLDDEEDDEDWTRDDENMDVSGQLSPPSSSLNSRRVSSSFRAALADLTYSGSTNGNSAERPKSNLFDWSEPSSAEKVDLMGNSPRPKTAHVKNIADGRGGRAVGRRGPSALHIRSQSVPVVPDVAGQRDHSKLAPKFGTWGLGGKGVSEDWDGDFEFENNDTEGVDEGDIKMENSGMLVPPAIQASQASVVGHVGQIREVCLLVEDLKRLRLLAREKGLLNGPSATLWKEAEGIIALAVPDEEDPALSPPPHSPASVVFETEASEDDDYHESGPDGEDLETSDAPFEVLNRHGRPTGFVYDGNTVRRRSVFSPEDDIFGAGLMNSPPVRDHLRLPSTSPRHSSMKSASDVARSVMETMHQHRSTSDPLLQTLASQSPNKMPFDTTSLRDLVHRASVLSRTLADLIRKADGNSQSPEVSPHRESSPAFTRVFTDPSVSPPKHLLRSQSNNSILSGSIDGSPTRSLGQRMHMMTVV